jgi:hypothetical protein
MDTKYFVVSLPRTGTSSICKMAKMCGLNPSHAPHMSIKSKINGNEFDFFSDTPVFCPTEIKRIINEHSKIKLKFIYINRNFEEIFDSWVRVKLYNNYTRMLASDYDNMKLTMKFDLDSYNDAFGGEKMNEKNYKDIFSKHKENVLSIIKNGGNDLLEYSFEKGWEPFCNFIGVGKPQDELPFLNKNKMFDKI